MSQPINRREFVKTGTFAAAGTLVNCAVRPAFDTIIINGLVADGAADEMRPLDIGVRDGTIAALGDLQQASAKRVIDAANLVVAPGFIDIHTHTDVQLLVNPLAESKIYQGVTTEVGGNCGSSHFPLNKADFLEMKKDLAERYDLDADWRTASKFLSVLEKAKPSLNFATFVGHGQIRSTVVGKNDVAPTNEQLRGMQRMLEQALDEGCVGLSTGLEYAPGSYAKTDELIALCNIVARRNKVYATHMRNEDDMVEEAIGEALRISRETGVSLQISHLKSCNQANWHKTRRFLEMLARERANGIPVHADRYPYIAYGTELSALLPLWARQGSTDEILRRLENPADIDKIKPYTEGRGQRIGGWDRVQISSCFTDANKRWEGKTIQQCCHETNAEPFEFIRKLLLQERNRVGMVGFAMDETNLHHVLKSPLVMIGSDGNAISPKGKLGDGTPHPRFYGTFPRVLGRYARDEKLFDWPTAVKKMTSMPAEKLGLANRGFIKQGYIADITIFDPRTVIDKATFTQPHQFAEGIRFVFVNGMVTINDGKHIGTQAGTVIRKT